MGFRLECWSTACSTSEAESILCTTRSVPVCQTTSLNTSGLGNRAFPLSKRAAELEEWRRPLPDGKHFRAQDPYVKSSKRMTGGKGHADTDTHLKQDMAEVGL